MPVQKEASHLWLFESHNNSKRSQWLQSTLSELEEKTKGMLKLIEGDADTFAQRAEMYYKKRPELVNMIEDFYRSYRSLAERYELLKLESGNSFSNRGYLNKDWSFIAKSSASSSVTCDSESEVDDPSEEEQVESKLREVPRNKNGNDLVNMRHIGGGEISQVGIKRERSDLSTYSIDSELSEVSYQGPEETKVETKSEEFLQKKSYICVVKQMIEKVESTEDKARTTADNKCFEHSDFHGKPKEGQDENNLAEFPEKADSSLSNSHILTEEAGRIQSMIKKMAERSGGGSSFEDLRVLHPEREETQGEHKLKEAPEKKRDDPETKLMSVVERLRGENMTFKNGNDLVNGKLREVPRNKNGDDLVNMKHIGGGEISQVGIKREISDLSTYSIDSELSEVSYLGPEETKVETKLEEFLQKKSCICVVKQMIGKVESTEDKARTAADNKCFEHSDFHGKPKEGQDENNSAEFPEKADSSLSNSNILTEEAGRIQSMIKKMAERSGGGSSFEDLRVLHPEREETQGEYELKEAPEKKRDDPETKLMSVVERLRGENMTIKAELELKDEEKREVIRQLSLSIDLLKGENDSMKKFIRYSKNRTSPFEFRKLKGVFSKLFASQSKFPTTLVAL